MAHIRAQHSPELDELLEFRVNQGEDPLSRNGLFEQAAAIKKQKKLQHKKLDKSEEANLKDQIALILATGAATDLLPLSFARSYTLNALIRLFQPDLTAPCKSLIDTSVMNKYSQIFTEIKNKVGMDIIRGSFTADAWSSKGNQRKFVGITLHYLEQDFTPRSLVIGFVALQPPHTAISLKNTIRMNNTLFFFLVL